jgi:uncharacterized protein (DUF849 family)
MPAARFLHSGPLLIQVANNGDRARTEHPMVPVSVNDLLRDAVACVAAGARALHVHPRDRDGRETVDAGVVNRLAREIRAACGVPVGVTTQEDIEPDVDRRLAQIRHWHTPDYASVNMCEEGSAEVMQTLLDRGIGVEAGIWSVADADALAASGFANRITRVLVEPNEWQVGSNTPATLELVERIHQTLNGHGIIVPRLQHSDGAMTWPVLKDALRRKLHTRIGFEDTLVDPDGKPVNSNAELVHAAIRLRNQMRNPS